MSAIAFLAALLALVLNGHEVIAGILLVAFLVLLVVFGHIDQRNRQDKFDRWRLPVNRSDK